MSTTTTPAVTNLAAVIVPVSDQDKMVDFYTEALGLEKRTDVPFGGGVEGRWVEVAPGGAQTPADGRLASACGPPTSTATTRPSRTVAWTLTRRSAASASPCRRSSGSAIPRGTS